MYINGFNWFSKGLIRSLGVITSNLSELCHFIGQNNVYSAWSCHRYFLKCQKWVNILQFLFQWETSPLRTSVWNSTAKQHSRLTLKVTEAWNQKLQFPEWISCYCLPVTGEHQASCSNTYCGEQKLSTGAPQVGMLWFFVFFIYIWVMYLFFQLYAFWWDNTKTRLVLSLSHKETDEYSGVLTLRCCSYSIYLFFHYCRYGFTSP